MFEEFTRAVDVVVEKHLRLGLLIRCHPERGVEIGFNDSGAPTPVPATESWGTVLLTDAEAREIQQVLEGLTEKYTQQSTGESRREYVMMLGLVPSRCCCGAGLPTPAASFSRAACRSRRGTRRWCGTSAGGR